MHPNKQMQPTNNPRVCFILLIIIALVVLNYNLYSKCYVAPSNAETRNYVHSTPQPNASYFLEKKGHQCKEGRKNFLEHITRDKHNYDVIRESIVGGKESISKLPKRQRVLFVIDGDEEFRHFVPLITEFLHAFNSKYVPVLALNQKVSINPTEGAEMLQLGFNEQIFICHSYWFDEFDPNGFEDVVSDCDPAAIISADGPGLIPHLVQNNAQNVSYLSLPAFELNLVKWLAHSPIEAYDQWRIPKVRLSVITATRPEDLKRLLRSLLGAYYLGDKVDIIINIDSIADKDTISICYHLDWGYGEKLLRHRVKQGGLISAVTESWYPGSFDEYGVLLEDDIEVSKFFYVWLRYNLMIYRYGNPQNKEQGLFGVSLYTPRKNELVNGKPKWNSNDFFSKKTGHRHRMYIQPLPCSWGAMFFPEIWLTFHHFLQFRMESGFDVQIQGSLTNGWSASWKKYFIEMANTFQLYMIYPNFENQTSFSTNHLGAGVHIQKSGGDFSHPAEDFTVPLVKKFDEIFAQLPGNTLPQMLDFATLSVLGDLEDTEAFLKNRQNKLDFFSLVTTEGSDLRSSKYLKKKNKDQNP